jgi:hypothetical protein
LNIGNFFSNGGAHSIALPRIDVTIEELKPIRNLLTAANRRRIPYCKQQKNNKREVYEQETMEKVEDRLSVPCTNN